VNYLQLVQRLHREAALSGNGPTTIVDAPKEHLRLFDWVADALRELESRPLDLRWMRRRVTITTVAAPTLDIPDISVYTPAALGLTTFGRWRPESDEWSVKCVDPTDATRTWNLHWMTLDQWRDAYVHSIQPAGQPSSWSVDDNNALLIGPAPDAAYAIRTEYLRAAQELTVDADTPEFDADLHLILMWRALVEAGKFENAPDVLARGQTNFARLEDNLLSRYTRRMTWGAPLA
jgi:hypothetical protein